MIRIFFSTNPVLAQVLGLCPLLAVSTSFVNAFVLSLATCTILILSNLTVSCLKTIIPNYYRLIYFVVVISSITTSIQLLMQAYAYPIYYSVGLFIPLIITNCIILGRMENFASKQNIKNVFFDSLHTSLGFAFVLILLGSIREILSNGTLFYHSHLFFKFLDKENYWLISEKLQINYFLFAPGGFLILALMLALRNYYLAQTEKSINKQNNTA